MLHPSKDFRFVGCLTEDELFNGATAMRAVPASHDKTLLELNNIGRESTANQWCNAIKRWVDGSISEAQMWAYLSARKVL